MGALQAEDYRSYIVEILKKLISIKTVNYDPADYEGGGPDGMESPGEEYRVADLIKKELDKNEIKYKVIGSDKRPDIFAFIGKGSESKRSILIAAHMDTVPSGSTPWTKTEPFTPLEENGRIYGRGAEDNKGQLAALLAAARILKKHEDEIDGQIIIAAVSDEEVNMCPGLTKAVRSGIINVTDAIIPDVGGSMKKITIAEKGRAVILVVAVGKAAHASRPRLGENAIDMIGRFLSLLSNYQLNHKADPLFPDGPTINPGIIRGGDAPNQVPGECKLLLDIRYLPDQTPADIVNELEKIAEDAAGNFKFAIRTDMPPSKVNSDAPIIKFIQKFADATPVGIGGGTVSRIMVQHGVDSVGWGPGDEDIAHATDEYADIDELVKFAGLICEIGIKLSIMER